MAHFRFSPLLVVATLAFLLPMLTALPVIRDQGNVVITSEPSFMQKRAPMDDFFNPTGSSGNWRSKARAEKLQRQREEELPYVGPFTDTVVTDKINRKFRHHQVQRAIPQTRGPLRDHHIAKEQKWQNRHEALEQKDRSRIQRIIGYYEERMQNRDLSALRRARAARYREYYTWKLSMIPSQAPPQTLPFSGGPSFQDPGTPNFQYGSIPGTPPFDFSRDTAGNWRGYR